MRPDTAASPPSGKRERVPTRTRILFGLGSVSEGTTTTVFNTFLLFYYNQILGVSGTLSGAAIFLALCVDAITDPLIGSLSDHTHSRWGRRHPYMYAAGLPMAASFVFLFNPPAGLGEVGLFAWLTVFAVLVRVSMTLYSIPSGSMVPELTSHYDERTTLMSYRFVFGFAGGLGCALVGYLVFFVQKDGVDYRMVPEAYQSFAIVCGAVMFVSILVCAVGTHHLIPTLRSPPEGGLTLASFFRELAGVLRNRSYRNVVLGLLFASVAAGFNDVVGLYMNTFFWEFSSTQIAFFVVAILPGIVLAAVLARPISERFDKKQAAVALTTFAVFFGPLPVFLRLLDLMPPNLAPWLFRLMLVHAGLIVGVIFAVSVIIASMITDVVDQNELETGKRQEGLIISAVTFTQKAASGIGGLVAGIALDLIAFPKGAEPGMVAADKLFSLGLAVGPGLLVFYLLLLFFLTRYDITRESHGETLAEIERRRAAAETGAGG
ncbi:MAG: MFS transporter [Deltaproteobacteria bacterium]|nr:MFS transporter [Deltaproteobacteria bacterium]